MQEKLTTMRTVMSVLIIVFVLLLLDLAATCFLIFGISGDDANSDDAQYKYVLYIGMNDKDSNTQELSLDECRSVIERVCLEHVSGFTISDASGVWTDDAGDIVYENTLLCHINGATEADVNAIASELLLQLNQSSILVESQYVSFRFVSE